MFKSTLLTAMVTLPLMLLAIAIFGSVGNSDEMEQRRLAQHYCDMVRSKAWPDYNHSYHIGCAEKVGQTKSGRKAR